MAMATDERLVIGLDSSTQSVKAIAWRPDGSAAGEGRAPIPISQEGLDCFEQDPRDWWRATVTALKALLDQVDAARLEGLAVSNQRETMGFFDAQGEATHPAILWLDGRTRGEVDEFSRSFGAEEIHRISGRPPDVTPSFYRVIWLRRNRPEAFARTACFADVQAYLVRQFCGGWFRTSWSSADPSGMFDLVEKRWSPALLDAIGIAAGRLPEAHAPGAELGRVTEAAARETGLPAGLPVFAGGGDGQCAGLGTGCTRPNRAYVNLGTAVVSGIWTDTYRYDPAWRTEIAAHGEGYILENCLRSGSYLVDWFVKQFVAGRSTSADLFAELEEEALKLPIGSGGVMVQPYWSGVMDPYWDTKARGVIVGLGTGHKPVHIHRAIIEGITLDLVMGTEASEAASGQTADHYLAIGGGANSKLWRQMLADASGKPVHVSDTVEASALGAGMIAAAGAGWYTTICDAADGMAGRTQVFAPDHAKRPRYRALLDIYRDLYAANASINQRLVDFAAGETS
ncbi:xylulokinase [Chelativorans sp. M5D2P16]|uniref:xylulokinase n=1 Tax=Chelativorans sp. M5D2P16 TaxID=3095678 RepID=UPI002ACA58E0|nr:FGGY family carbohydrate kinase [Chelativorans sp. M5D2P16]MDZ5700128.1 FGGY family carbohydrate kinase [Chelativorans sp. M5D2P16]